MVEAKLMRHNLKYILLVLFVIALMLITMNAVYKYVSNIVLSANIETMRELAVHDQKAISSSISSRVSDAENLADSLASQSILSIQELHESLNAANYQLKTKKIYLLGSNGKFYSSNGTAKEDADYAGMVSRYPEGFLDRLPSSSKKFNDGLLLIGRPIDGFSVEGIKFSYIITETKLVDLAGDLSTSSYNGQGRSVIIDLDGNYIVNEEGRLRWNAFEELRGDFAIKGESIDSYIGRIINEQDTSVILSQNGEDIISLTTHTPEGWILISFCPLSVFAEESNRITSLFAFLSLFFVAAVAITLVFIMRTHSRRQLEEQFAEIQRLNGQLVENQAKLEESVSEQESQIEEISALNTQLQCNQARLEEAAAEQESQLEEIAALNEQLRERQVYSDTLYHKLIKIQSCGVVAYKVPTYEILIMNDMARTIYGISPSADIDDKEAISRIAKARYDEEEATRARLRNVKNPGDQCSFSFWLDDTDGTERHVYAITQLIQMDNGDKLVVSSLLDITEITRMERKTAQANAANAAKTSFLFNMSHDIRTPMNAIIGYTNLMEKNLDDREKTRDYLRKVKDSSDFLLSLINNVLEMARIESGKMMLDEEIIRPEVVTDEITSVYAELMRAKGIHFTLTRDVKTSYIYCDKVKSAEIFLNLVSNAYKYTPSGGTVTSRMVELPCEKEGWTILQTTVTDTGIGMSKEYLPVLFEEFSRAQNTTEARIEGTGLGMPIVKKLVDLMGGTITVESELGKGTSFVVTVPHRIGVSPETFIEQAKEVNTDVLEGKRILLAEDNDMNAEIAMEILSDAGIEVDRAEDGIICVDMLSKAAAGTYDIILMDIQMPNLDGYKATEKIRRMEDPRKAGIPIVAMTANAFEEDKRNALCAGMNAHLAKPVRVSELMKALTGILG